MSELERASEAKASSSDRTVAAAAEQTGVADLLAKEGLTKKSNLPQVSRVAENSLLPPGLGSPFPDKSPWNFPSIPGTEGPILRGPGESQGEGKKPGPERVPERRMPEIDPLCLPEGTKNPSKQLNDEKRSGADDPLYEKFGRTALVIGGGLGESVLYGMANLPRRWSELATSAAFGASLSALTKTGKIGNGAALIAGAYFTSRFIVNAIEDRERWTRFGAAVSDSWKSDENLWRNMHEVSNTGGNFAFDMGISMGAGYLGYTNKQVADLLLQIFRFPVPLPGPMPPMPNAPQPRNPFFPQVGTVGMLMQIAPPPSIKWTDEPNYWKHRGWFHDEDRSRRERERNSKSREEKEASEMLGADSRKESEQKERRKEAPAAEKAKDQAVKTGPDSSELARKMLGIKAAERVSDSSIGVSTKSPELTASTSFIANPELRKLVYGRSI